MKQHEAISHHWGNPSYRLSGLSRRDFLRRAAGDIGVVVLSGTLGGISAHRVRAAYAASGDSIARIQAAIDAGESRVELVAGATYDTPYALVIDMVKRTYKPLRLIGNGATIVRQMADAVQEDTCVRIDNAPEQEQRITTTPILADDVFIPVQLTSGHIF